MYEDIKTACLYVRFSSHNQTEQSIEGQTRVCRDFCKRHNIRIVEIYADRATSASKDIEKRVQFLKMIKDSEKGLFDAVIVYKLDRFARSRYDSATYKYRLKRNGVQLISATENISNDPEGIILESVLEGMAEFYSAELSQKINRGMRESAYKHNSIGGAIPLGYKIEDKKLVIDPKTAPIVKEAFEKYADGETVAEICRQFNARGYKTSKGTAFGKSSFTKIFRNERYIGVYTFHDYRAEDAIPAIIDKDLWDRVQLRVGKIKNAPARNKAKVVYLLSGKIFCGHCGSKMNGNCNAGNYCYYQCYGKKNGNVDCKKKNIRKEFIERLVAQDALSLLTDEYIEQIATIACEKNQHEIELDSALPTIRDRIHQVDLSLNHLLKAIESGSAPDMLVKRMGELEKEKKDLQAQAKKESEDIVELDKAQVIYWLEQFRGGSIEDEEFCRMLIDLFVNSVTVWDEDDNTYKVTVAYNLTSLPTKTYRLNKGGTLSDFASNAPAFHRQHSHQYQHTIDGHRRNQIFDDIGNRFSAHKPFDPVQGKGHDQLQHGGCQRKRTGHIAVQAHPAFVLCISRPITFSVHPLSPFACSVLFYYNKKASFGTSRKRSPVFYILPVRANFTRLPCAAAARFVLLRSGPYFQRQLSPPAESHRRIPPGSWYPACDPCDTGRTTTSCTGLYP